MASPNPLPTDPLWPLSKTIHTRHTTRAFKPDPVPPHLLHEALTLAQRAPSNSNMQNWRLILASGPARTHIISSLSHTARTSPDGPNIPPLPEGFKKHRDEFVQLLYGPSGYDVLGEGEGKREARQEKRLLNFSFFNAPVVGVICQDARMGMVDAMCVGMFVNSFLLALTERGLGSSCLVSVTGYEEVLRREFGVEEGWVVLCGIAVGWEEEGKMENGIRTGREGMEECVRFLE